MHPWNQYLDDPEFAGKRVFAVEHDGTRYWIKRATKDYRNRLQRILCAIPSPLRDEVTVMHALRKRHMLVPELVHAEEDFIVTTDIGPTLQDVPKTLDAAGRLSRIADLANMLNSLHARGGWHGNAALRNFTWDNGRIGMIDFENSQHRRWSLRARQAFDIWQVLYFTARREDGAELARHFLRHYNASPSARAFLRMLAMSVSPLYMLLSPFRAWLKRDLQQALVSISLLLFQ